MHLHITTILFIIFEHINKIFTQGIPLSPCPKLFQYRFDGNEWFGILSVRNPDFGQSLHLKVMLSMRGKPSTNYLGEIELLTRGQFQSDSPVLYKIKFPKSQFPPRLLQATTNEHVVCLGPADHSIFVTHIQLEHTRKFTFIVDDMSNPLNRPSSMPASPSQISKPTDIKNIPLLPANTEFDTKSLQPPSLFEMNPMRTTKDICGTIDDRIRFQIFHSNKKKKSTILPLLATKHTKQNEDINSYTAGILLTPPLASSPSSSFRAASKGIGKGRSKGSIPLVTDVDDEQLNQRNPLLNDDGSTTSVEELPTITRGAWPWLAAIYVNNLTSLAYHCGGTLVSSRIVISSAHCFQLFKQRYTSNEVLVFLGRHNLKNWNEEGSLAAPVEDIFIHPDYDSHLNTYDADIAVVVLKNDVQFNTFIRPACMWSGSTKSEYIEGEQAVVVGWGLGNTNVTSALSNRQTIPKLMRAPIVSNELCFKVNSKFQSLASNRTFCAGIITPSKVTLNADGKANKPNKQHPQTGPCNGDSGAGLMIFHNNRWILRGTVSATLAGSSGSSMTLNNCKLNQYVLYSDVAKFLDWIFAFII